MVCAATASCGSSQPEPSGEATKGWFTARSIPLNTWRIFDVGVVDADGDGNLDVFTTNHHSQQTLLRNDGRGNFRNVTSQSGFDFDPSFPGWERLTDAACPGSGLSVYRRGDVFQVEFAPSATAAGARGAFHLLSPVKTSEESNVQVSVEPGIDNGQPSSTVEFAFRGKGGFRIRPDHLSLPMHVKIGDGLAPATVFVGAQCVVPKSREFDLRLTDRHGMAWADYNGDGRLDVYVTAGGLRGDIGDYTSLVKDELFVNEGGTVRDVFPATGIDRGPCRGRQAAWSDVDGDGRLDVALSCYEGNVHVFRQQPGGAFVNADEASGLAGVKADTIAWLDVDGDGRTDLVAETAAGVVVMRLAPSGRFERSQELVVADKSKRTRRDERVRKLAIADWDADGDPDMFLPSAGGNFLLVNERGTFRALSPASIGLPPKSVMAEWVDYDNDGLVDLHSVPGGLYHQGADGRFTETGILAEVAGSGTDEARIQWFDYDNDGRRDVLVATADEGERDLREFEAQLFHNVSQGGHWLEVDVAGLNGHADATGARVRVVSGGRTQTHWVGHADGSVFSQGHNRVYFGLGAVTDIASVEVTWRDGTTRTLTGVSADRLLRVDSAP